MEANIIFNISNVSKIYNEKTQEEVKALNDVSLDITKGEFAAIVGPSGSGKSTLLNIMSGLDYPTEGTVLLAGMDISKMKMHNLADFRRDHIGFIFQSYNLIPVLKVYENVEYVMQLQKVPQEERKTRIAKILKDVGLQGMENRFPHQLSGGQKQRVAVARAMVTNPDIILADEPTANLDSKTGTELIDMMKELNKKYSTTFIFSTHDRMIMDKASRIIKLQDGKLK